MRHPSAIVVSCLKRWLKGSEFDGVYVATKVPDELNGPMVRVNPNHRPIKLIRNLGRYIHSVELGTFKPPL